MTYHPQQRRPAVQRQSLLSAVQGLVTALLLQRASFVLLHFPRALRQGSFGPRRSPSLHELAQPHLSACKLGSPSVVLNASRQERAGVLGYGVGGKFADTGGFFLHHRHSLAYLGASLLLGRSLLSGRARTRQPRHSASQRVKARPLRAACTCAPCSRNRHSTFFSNVRSRRAVAAAAVHAPCSRRTRSQALRARQARSAARVAASEDAAAAIRARALAVERRRRWAARAASQEEQAEGGRRGARWQGGSGSN